MKPTYTILAALSVLVLGACNSHDGDDTPPVRATELATGNYVISAGDVAAPAIGKYYAAADGSRLAVLNDDQDKAAALFQRDGKGAWSARPAGAALDLLGKDTVAVPSISVSAVVGHYSVRLSGGTVAAFSINAAGEIVPGTTGCRLSGKLAASPFEPALKLVLLASGCGNLPSESNGYLVADRDYAPAAFRLLASANDAVLDLWAYAD